MHQFEQDVADIGAVVIEMADAGVKVFVKVVYGKEETLDIPLYVLFLFDEPVECFRGVPPFRHVSFLGSDVGCPSLVVEEVHDGVHTFHVAS